MQGYGFEKKQQERRWFTWKNILLVLIYLVLVCVIIVGAIYLYPRLCVSKQDQDYDMCLSEDCLKAALQITSSMNQSQDPCHDFYQFACGNFIAKAYERSIPSQYYSQQLIITDKLDAVVAEPITGEEEGLYLQQKRLYQSCMDLTAIDAEGFEPFMNLLEEFGGWPVVKGPEWKEKDIDLNEIILKCMHLGLPFEGLFEISIDTNGLSLYHPKVAKLPSDPYKESGYLNLMAQTAVALGAASTTFALGEMEQVIWFEKKLETIATRKDQNFVPYKLNDTFVIIPWLKFIKHITRKYSLEGDTQVILNEIYLKQLNLLLAETPKRIQVDFIVWKVVQEFGFYLAKPVREYFLNFTDFVPETQQLNSRFKFCVKESITRFPRIAETEFIRKYINEDKIGGVKDLISNIKNQFINRLDAAEWIDESTKEFGINKVQHIVDIIGQHYLDFDKNLLTYFLKLSDLEFLTSKILDMIRKKNQDTLVQRLEKQNTTIDIDLTKSFFLKTFDVHAEYKEIYNILFISVGIIQEIFYGLNRPNYLNYGALGSIIGHEIAHAISFNAAAHESEEEIEIITNWFNNTPESINEVLILNITNLWQNESLEALNSRLSCIIEELADREYKDTTIAKNFADLVGIDTAFEAYVAWAEQYESEQQLPGLRFSPRQLFWIQFGTMNCYRQIDSVPWTTDTGTHSTLPDRVTKILQNSDNFAKEFECPEGSVMNPIKKCRFF